MPSEYSPEEFGSTLPPPKPVDPRGQPRGDAHFPVPHPATFAGSSNWANRAYFYAFDRAMEQSRTNAELMRLDPVIDGCIRLRCYPTALLPSHVEPDDDTDAFQVECAANTERRLSNLPGYVYARRWMLYEGLYTGRSGVQTRWEWVPKRGRNWHLPTGFKMVAGDKLVFKWDGRVGIRVASSFPLPTEADSLGRVYMLTPEEREQVIVHQFEPEDTDFFVPTRAGAIHGTGYRHKLFWLWALKMRVWGMGMDFLQWFAKGLTVYYFQSGNDAHMNEVRSWIEAQDGNSALMFPRLPDGTPSFPPIERFEASTASPAFLQQLITQYFDELFRIAIIGQTLTSKAAATGLGSGVADAHVGTFENFVKYDSVGIGETETRDLVAPFYRANFPGVPPGRRVLDVDDPNVQQMIENAQAVYQMGAAIPEGALLETAGIPEVKQGDTILTNVQPMQPAAVGPTPDNVPVVQGQPAGPQGEPVKMSLRQWATAVTMARKGDRRAQKLFRTRRVEVAGLSPRYVNRSERARR